MSLRPGFLIAALAVLAVKPSGSRGAAPAGLAEASVGNGWVALVVIAMAFHWGRHRE